MNLKRRLPIKVWSQSTTARDLEGNFIKAWTWTTVSGDIQPIGNRTRTMADFGRDNLQPDSRILYGASTDLGSVTYGQVVEYPTGAFYSVVGVAPWYMHSEILLEPYQGTNPA